MIFHIPWHYFFSSLKWSEFQIFQITKLNQDNSTFSQSFFFLWCCYMVLLRNFIKSFTINFIIKNLIFVGRNKLLPVATWILLLIKVESFSERMLIFGKNSHKCSTQVVINRKIIWHTFFIYILLTFLTTLKKYTHKSHTFCPILQTYI